MIIRTLMMKILHNILTKITGIHDTHPLYYIIYCVTQIKEDTSKSSNLNNKNNISKEGLIASSRSDDKIFIDYRNLISDHSMILSDINSSTDDTEYQMNHNDANLTNDDDHLSNGSSSICIIASDTDFCENDNISLCSFVVFDVPNQYSYEEEIVCSYFICSNRPSGEDTLQLIDSSGTLIKSLELEKEKAKEHESSSRKLITAEDLIESTIYEKYQHLTTINGSVYNTQEIKEFYKDKLELKDGNFNEDIYEDDFISINMKDLIICNNRFQLECTFNKTKKDTPNNTQFNQLYNLSDGHIYLNDEINFNKENNDKDQSNKSTSSYSRSFHGECNYIRKNITIHLNNRPDGKCIWIYKRNDNILAISEPFIFSNNSQERKSFNEKINNNLENLNFTHKPSRNHFKHKMDSILDENVVSSNNLDEEEVTKIEYVLSTISKKTRGILEMLGKNDYLLKDKVKIIKEEISNIYFYILHQNSLLNKIKFHYDDANNIIKLQTKQIHSLKTLLDTFTITENVTSSMKKSAF